MFPSEVRPPPHLLLSFFVFCVCERLFRLWPIKERSLFGGFDHVFGRHLGPSSDTPDVPLDIPFSPPFAPNTGHRILLGYPPFLTACFVYTRFFSLQKPKLNSNTDRFQLRRPIPSISTNKEKHFPPQIHYQRLG